MIDLDKSRSRILIVDDEESLRLTFRMFLSKEGYGPIDVASTFDEARTTIENSTYDLIISDIVLEGHSGIDLLRKVKEVGMECPVVMVTGYPNIETASESVRLGAFDYLSKPVKKQDLLRVARMALQQYTLWRERERLRQEKDRYRTYLETVFNSVSDGIVTVDPDLHIVEMNATIRDWVQHLVDVRIGASIASLPGRIGEICRRDTAMVIADRKPLHEHRVECRWNDLGEKVFQVTAAPLAEKNGRLLGAVVLLRDITRLTPAATEKRSSFHRFIGTSRAMQTVYTLIEHVGQVDTAVLITGESGTGKELAAEALHVESSRKEMPLVKVDCTAIPENLLESELFGHRKGSFTGADRDRKGRILLADGGTLFLDEIGDISPQMQLRLLRFLQEKTFYPVGQDTPVSVDVRVIAATNADLKKKVAGGEFREDLYFRLRVVDLPLPPLRDREGDLPLLVNYFISRHSKRMGREITGISDQALSRLNGHVWPGNVRELEHVLERACVLCKGPTITTEHLSDEVFSAYPFEPSESPVSLAAASASRSRRLDPPPEPGEGEESRILRVLQQTAGNKAKAARMLGVDRSTLYRKLHAYNIDPSSL